MTIIRERYSAIALAADATHVLKTVHIAGFIPVTEGAITVTNSRGVVLVNAAPLTAGVYMPLPIYVGDVDDATVVLSGGASGTLLV